jgi:hypothetical protein
MLPLIQFIAVSATTIFSGAAIYINLVEHPARMSCSTQIAAELGDAVAPPPNPWRMRVGASHIRTRTRAAK